MKHKYNIGEIVAYKTRFIKYPITIIDIIYDEENAVFYKCAGSNFPDGYKIIGESSLTKI